MRVGRRRGSKTELAPEPRWFAGGSVLLRVNRKRRKKDCFDLKWRIVSEIL